MHKPSFMKLAKQEKCKYLSVRLGNGSLSLFHNYGRICPLNFMLISLIKKNPFIKGKFYVRIKQSIFWKLGIMCIWLEAQVKRLCSCLNFFFYAHSRVRNPAVSRKIENWVILRGGYGKIFRKFMHRIETLFLIITNHLIMTLIEREMVHT